MFNLYYPLKNPKLRQAISFGTEPVKCQNSIFNSQSPVIHHEMISVLIIIIKLLVCTAIYKKVLLVGTLFQHSAAGIKIRVTHEARLRSVFCPICQ